jgi:hypothetical protein
MRNVYLLAILAFTAASCSPQKRLARLLNHHPELVKDTTFTDTVTISSFLHDTTLQLSSCDSGTTDTFIVEKPRFITTIIRSGKNLEVSTLVHDTSYISRQHIKYVQLPAVKKACHYQIKTFLLIYCMGFLSAALLLFFTRRR